MYVEEMRWSRAARWALFTVTAFPVVVGVVVVLVAPGPAARALALILLPGVLALIAGIGAAFGRLRVAVDAAALTVGFGPFRERLPVARIVSCDPVTYRWQDYGGWGIRYNLRRRAKLYNVTGDGGQAVQVVLDDGRRVLFS